MYRSKPNIFSNLKFICPQNLIPQKLRLNVRQVNPLNRKPCCFSTLGFEKNGDKESTSTTGAKAVHWLFKLDTPAPNMHVGNKANTPAFR